MATNTLVTVIGVLMAFYVCQFSAWTYDDEEAAILIDLENSPLEDADLDDLFDDSSEIGARSAKNVLKKLEEKCKCEELTCYCCAAPKIVGISFNACVNMTMFPSENLIEIAAGGVGNSISQNISVGKLERVCDRLPGFLKKIKLCMYNTWKENSDEASMTTCSSIDVHFGSTTVASVKFHCLELKDGKLSFTIPPDTGRSAIMSLKMKNPIKSLFSFFKKKITGANKE